MQVRNMHEKSTFQCTEMDQENIETKSPFKAFLTFWNLLSMYITKKVLILYPLAVMHLSMLCLWRGGGVGQGVGIWHFSENVCQNPLPGEKISCQKNIKIPALGQTQLVHNSTYTTQDWQTVHETWTSFSQHKTHFYLHHRFCPTSNLMNHNYNISYASIKSY